MKSKRRISAILVALGLVCALALTGCGPGDTSWSNAACWDGGTHNYSWFLVNRSTTENLVISSVQMSPSEPPDTGPMQWSLYDWYDAGIGVLPPNTAIGSATNNLYPSQQLIAYTYLESDYESTFGPVLIDLTPPENCGAEASGNVAERPTEIDSIPVRWVE